MKLKVIKDEQIKNRIVVTVEKTSFWGRKSQLQFIDSNDQFELIHEDVWYTYPEFTTVSWFGMDSKYHQLLNGWKRYYLLHLNSEK
jgi:hypothetical protein